MKLPQVAPKYRVLIPLVLLFIILTLIFPRQAKFSYDYRKGSPWEHETLVAQFDFPILKTDEQMREDKGRSKALVIPYYRFRQDVVDNGKKAIESLDLNGHSSIRPLILSAMDAIWSGGVVPDEGLKLDSRANDTGTAVVYVQKDKRVSKRPAAEILRETDAKAKLLSLVSAKTSKTNLDSLFRACDVYDVVSANLEYDARTTDLVNSENASQVSTTQGFVSAGQLIVSEGEIVTAEIAQILDSYKVEFENNLGYGGPKFLFWLGNALLALILTLLFFLLIYFLNKGLFKEPNRFGYLLFVFLLTTVITLLVNKFAPRYLYMAPLTLTALYLEAFFRNKMILPICCLAFLPLLIFSSNGVVLYVMFIVASQVAVFAFKYFNHGWQQFTTAAIVFVSLVLTYSAFRSIDMVNDNPYHVILSLFLGSMMTVAGYTLIFLFEKVFNLLSSSRLQDMCDTSNPLIRDLEQKAPGTFQHSLQVMNMCDAAARGIDANVALVKAGALYHDIGKMQNPLCFIENESAAQAGTHYHDGLAPKQSAMDIIRHIDDGMELARQHKLPEVISDFIVTHHGTSSTAFFLNKYLNEGGSSQDVADFYYKGRKPQTKEQVILMICDTLEAASRTLKDNSPETFSKFVDGVVASKMQMGQFDEADISIKDLTKLKEVMKGYLSQIYHERVAYPGRKNVNNQK